VALHIELVVIDMLHDNVCPIIFGRTFLNQVNAKIDCKEETIYLKFGGDKGKFHFSKFIQQSYYRDLEDQEGTTIVDVATIFYGTPVDNIEGSLENKRVLLMIRINKNYMSYLNAILLPLSFSFLVTCCNDLMIIIVKFLARR
jgi:hypothetical protein